MSKGFFTDKTVKPDFADILNVIGSAGADWDMLLKYLTGDLKLKGEFKFYGVNYGWALRFTKSGKSVAALYPGKDYFTVQVILNKNQIERALSEITDAVIIKTINDTEQIYEGKWIFLTINGATDMKEIIKMIQIRIKIK